ncbi:GGL domain protein [Opisthorchis viverrini]|uniref:Guanine nucleotide-binding protein subunit gamma n=2 Tax=Opisthorchis viverrini TaxID=6198 RepID=A0A1S8WUS7_OPIVI|nr:GGL domain protein [Opisthorchis viverrini]
MSTLTQQRKLVEQLRQEANLNRRPVSECVRDMIAYMEQNREKDCLVSGFASKKDNPFQEKGGCLMLVTSLSNDDWLKYTCVEEARD